MSNKLFECYFKYQCDESKKRDETISYVAIQGEFDLEKAEVWYRGQTQIYYAPEREGFVSTIITWVYKNRLKHQNIRNVIITGLVLLQDNKKSNYWLDILKET